MTPFPDRLRHILLRLLLLFLWLPTAYGNDSPAARLLVILLLGDRSYSMNGFSPPESQQAVMLHVLDLAKLSRDQVRVGLVLFGGQGVTVLGDETGMPTAAHATLRNQVLRNWPKSSGATPMDSGFQETLKIVEKLPAEAEIVVILITDGQPDSGRLRPEEFPGIATAIETRRKALALRYEGFPPAIVQAKLGEWNRELQDPSTAEFQRLYRDQVQAEYQTTLQHAGVLQRRGVRFVTFDLLGVPDLEPIHRAAGGRDADLVRTNPNDVLGKLHERKLLNLPGVIQMTPRRFSAESQVWNRAIEFLLERIFDAHVQTIEFNPAIAGFSTRSRLVARVGGESHEFTVDGDESASVLTHDSQGNVTTATLSLDNVPGDGQGLIEFDSPSASLHPPACVFYQFARLRTDITADFRPAFVKESVLPPFSVSPGHEAEWSFGLRLAEESNPYSLKGVEAVLQEVRSGTQTRVPLVADPQSPGMFRTAKTKLATGRYHVELHIILPSGASFTLTLRDHIHAIARDEAISVEFEPHSADPTLTPSASLGHIDFSLVGKPQETRAISLTLRSKEFDYPVSVIPAIVVNDPQGITPKETWLRLSRTPVTINPGRAERVRLILTLPKNFEATLVDGLYEGRLVLLHAETNQPIRLVRFQPIVGVPDDSPAERITFELKRPQLVLAMPHALRNWIRARGDERLDAMIRVSIDQSFEREVTLTASHDAGESQEVTIVPSGDIKDRQGRLIPGLRLVPVAGDPPTKDLPPKNQAKWRFVFQADESFNGGEAEAGFDVSGPGLAPRHVAVQITRRQPLLANTIRTVCLGTVAVMVLLLLRAVWRWLRASRFRTGRELIVTPGRALDPFLQVEAAKEAVRLEAQADLRIKNADRRQPTLVSAERSQLLPASELDRRLPIEIQPADMNDPPQFRFHKCRLQPGSDPELHLTVIHGGRFDTQADRAKQSIQRALVIAALSAAIALTLKAPAVLRTAQWIFDFIVSA